MQLVVECDENDVIEICDENGVIIVKWLEGNNESNGFKRMWEQHKFYRLRLWFVYTMLLVQLL